MSDTQALCGNTFQDDLTLVGPSGEDFVYAVPREAGIVLTTLRFLHTYE
jgi:hypothetical protein